MENNCNENISIGAQQPKREHPKAVRKTRYVDQFEDAIDLFIGCMRTE